MALQDPFGWIGATIEGKYRLDAVVGEGGFGVVYRGHHLGFDEAVAVKCLKLSGSMAPAEREAFHRTFLEEGKLLHRLSRASAGIVQALDVGAAVSPSGAWTPFLVLEWLRGSPLDRDLAERRARGEGGRPLAEAVALLAPAARAIEVAHAQGVAHRDIKPANLFLAEVGGRTTLKVLDFGIAKVLGDLSSMTKALAETGSSLRAFTPRYGAPEQFHRRYGATGPWTDVFALALVLIELASGDSAMHGDDATQLYITATDPALRPSLRGAGVGAPEVLEAVLRRALAVDPRERYRTAGELWDAIEAALPEAAAPPRRAQRDGSAPRLPSSPGLPAELASMPTGEFLGLQPQSGATVPPTVDRGALEMASTELPAARRGLGVAGPGPTPAPAAHAGLREAPTMLERPATTGGGVAGPAATTAPAAVAPRSGERRRAALLFVGGALVAGAGAVALGVLRRPVPQAPPPPVVEAAPARASGPPPDMVRVPAGRFTMGSATDKDYERPPHEVELTRAFDLDRAEVTAADYQRCVQAGKCTPSGVHGPRATEADVEKRGSLCTAADPAKARHPITCVDQAQAAVYCAFMGKRLPTEAEWEYAARGADGRAYPWGNDAPACEHANVARVQGQGCGRPRGTMAVGSLPAGASAFGALDMAGNTWEWVADGWDPGAYAKGARVDPVTPATGERGVLRGGSWDFDRSRAKATARLAFDRAAGDASTGFRCARAVE
jgi:eukaryotic-like serine/threonine-protein kinase